MASALRERLDLYLLGAPRVRLGDQPLTGFAHYKAQALLFYLAVTGQTHSRAALATLLWSEMGEAQAQNNLRAVLPTLRRLVGQYLVIERHTIAFDHTSPYWLDVEALRHGLQSPGIPVDRTVSQRAWEATAAERIGAFQTQQAAVALYQGEFLQGFYVQHAPVFEAWVLEQREQLHTLVVNTLTKLVNAHVQTDDQAAALAANRQLLVLEPWSEQVHQQQMRLLAQMGEHAAALAQYTTCRRVLAAEFGIEPLPETTALYEQIRLGRFVRPGESTTNQPASVMVQSTTIMPEPEGTARPQEEPLTAGAKPNAASALPRLPVAGHHLPLGTKLYGRQAELATLRRWLLEEGCRLVGIFGIGGQGKTALATTFVGGLAEASGQPGGHFRHIIWQTLLNAPPLTEVLQQWVYLLSDQAVASLPTGLDQQFSLLFDYLRRQRTLLILDNLESILQSGEYSGHFRPGFEGYEQLLHRLAEGEHRSCLLLTSRERPPAWTVWEEDNPAVRTLALTGLPSEAGRQLLQQRGLAANPAGLHALVQHYSGNPLALKLVAETVQEIFDGDIAAFLKAETLVFDNIRYVLDQQFARLTPLERELLLWLAVLREPVPFNALRALLAQPPAGRPILEAVRSLQRRSLLERFDEGFGLQNVVMEYATDLLIESISRELLDDKMTRWQGDTAAERVPPGREVTLPSPHPVTLSYLNRYALILAQVKEYVRASQTRQLLQPVGDRLVDRLGRTGAEQQLQRLLMQVRTVQPRSGYAAANLLHLLLQLGVDLHGYDFSQLYFRQAHLRGVSLPQTNFTGAEIVDSVFTEPFGLIYAVAFSPDGQYVAAGTTEGAIYIWRTADQQLAQVIQAHQHALRELTFAQQPRVEGDGATPPLHDSHLASASDDKSVGLWVLDTQGSVRQQVRLVHAQQGMLAAVDLDSDSQRVTSVDVDGQVFVWDVSKHQNPQLVQHFATAFSRIRLVAFSRDGQTVAIGHRDGTVRLWQVATGEMSLQLAGTTGLIFTLVLSGDGRVLVTGGREGHLSLWRLPTGELHQVMELRPHCVIETKAGAIRSLAISPDGKFLASGHEDLAIRLWAIDAQANLHLQRTLVGHTQRIWSIAFSSSPASQPEVHPKTTDWVGNRNPTRQLLVTGGSDQTVRVWDVETGHTLYMLRGQARVLAAHTIRQLPPTPLNSQSGRPQAPRWVLAAAGYDQLIHLWQGQGNAVDSTHRVLHGAHGPLYAVAISPDGRSVAGGGYDRTIYLWDLASGQLRQTFHGHTNSVYALAFHPDGKLLASGSGDGTMRLWLAPEMADGQGSVADEALLAQPVAVLQADLDVVHDLAFSPDGRILARGGSDRLLRLWDMTQSHYPELVEARRRVQDEGEEDIFAVAFSPDGSKVACCGNHLIHLVDIANGTAPLILRHHTAWIYSAPFSPDGKTLASSGADCTVCLWDISTSLNTSVALGAPRVVLQGHRETVYKVAFTPDGTAVVSSSFDGTIKFWDSHSGECINTLHIEGPYAEMNITGVTGITEAQKMALKALGAVAA